MIGGTIFPHKTSHLATWVSPDLKTENQIDDICISRKFCRSLQDVRVKRGVDAASDHHFLVANIKLKLKKHQVGVPAGIRYDVKKLKDHNKQVEFKLEFRNRFSALQNREEKDNGPIESYWELVKTILISACEITVGRKTREHKEWISHDTLIKVERRKTLKESLNNTKTRAAKQKAQHEYTQADKEVKNSARKDKRNFITTLTSEAEEAARQNNIKVLYDIIRSLTNKFRKGSHPIKDKNGKALKTPEEQMKRWFEHFNSVLNQQPPVQRADIPPAATLLPIDCSRPGKEEIAKAIMHLKNNKSPGPDNIPAEILKADINTITEMLYELIGLIWEEEMIPMDWKEGHLVKLPKKGDLSICDNYRGTMLLSVPGKVLNRVMLQRMKNGVDTKLRDNQAGFRQNRSCANPIATLRIILEQASEFNSSIDTVFIDFQKAFDSLDREVLWQLM